MLTQRRLSLLLALLLVSCSQAAQPTPSPASSPTSVAAVATSLPTATQPVPTAAPTLELTPSITASPTSEPTMLPSPTFEPGPEPLTLAAAPALSEQVVLQLTAGNGTEQVGFAPYPNNPELMQGPGAFRIGSDSTIRVLDRVNKRVLFFSPDGKPGRVQPITEAQDPIDYIVNNDGEVFVFDNGVYHQETGQQHQKQVLLYKPNGRLNTRYPIADAVQANGIMLNTQQDLFLVSGSFYENAMSTTIFSSGKAVDVAHQTLTMHRGLPTPRSPMMFTTRAHPGGDGLVGLDVLLAQLAREPRLIMDNLALPASAQFLNVDRAMNLYFMEFASEGNAVRIWRVAPDTSISGGGSIDVTGCEDFNWRSIYIAQDGEAWRMCNTKDTTTLSRYNLIGTDAKPLGKVEKMDEQASKNVPWAPGGNFIAA